MLALFVLFAVKHVKYSLLHNLSSSIEALSAQSPSLAEAAADISELDKIKISLAQLLEQEKTSAKNQEIGRAHV